MDLSSLRTFVAAYEEANFTKAAARLHATQPGVSVKIATLEDELGMPLFVRSTRSVTPTVAAKRLYPKALKLIHDLNCIAQEMQALSGSVCGQVAVGIPPTLSKAILAPVLSNYLNTYPGVDVRIFEAHSDTLLSLIEKGELDFAVVTKLADHPALNYQKIFRDRFVVAAASGTFPQEEPVHLNREPYLKMVVLRCALNGVLNEPMRIGQIVPAKILEVDGLAGAVEFLASSDWVALLPSATAHRNSERSCVQFNPFAGDQVTIDYYTAHAKTEPISAAAQAFINLMASEFGVIGGQRQPVALKGVDRIGSDERKALMFGSG